MRGGGARGRSAACEETECGSEQPHARWRNAGPVSRTRSDRTRPGPAIPIPREEIIGFLANYFVWPTFHEELVGFFGSTSLQKKHCRFTYPYFTRPEAHICKAGFHLAPPERARSFKRAFPCRRNAKTGQKSENVLPNRKRAPAPLLAKKNDAGKGRILGQKLEFGTDTPAFDARRILPLDLSCEIQQAAIISPLFPQVKSLY